MLLRTELGLTLGGLFALNLLLVFGAVGLFGRMGPAIERILEENVYSIVAAEEVLATIARGDTDRDPVEARVRIEAALARARDNVTEPEEPAILAAIEAQLDAALAGSSAARRSLVASVGDLLAVNRDAMRRVDAAAQRLGRAGAWASVFVGLLSIGLSLVVVARLRSRVIRPLAELRDVLAAAGAGDRFRRCGMRTASREILDVAAAVDGLLDERTDDRPAESD